ncbi:monooxygenase [Sodiomyces alkalinus F11]|uniref:Monooxygenase n=1 Tax=Sodiomyces alkalinus (strain CBS 110278 / VKM F-3762 / F11) TaxID=1314773 RepID=A0A3N2PYR7_SODAK|nr:monooxygenase [Sodiomyces alkalinus F11]ROT39634.1 monooxygenase [Sodiomyces alkalinus F11]
MPTSPEVEHLDVLVLGAGLSGINAAYRVQQELPGLSYAVLDRRDVIGGTWSFWRYPGFRCDASMTTFGFSWHPWTHNRLIIEGPPIVDYIQDAVRTQGIDRHIRLHHRVRSANWDSAEARWVLEVDVGPEPKEGGDGDGNGTDTPQTVRKIFKASFLFMCTGYYSYERALEADIPGIKDFAGVVAHPQWWPEDLDHTGKRVIIIGSGATAITLFPTMAQTASHTTMLQRSPSFVFSPPTESPMDQFLRRFLPLWLVHWIAYARDLVRETLFVTWLLAFPRVGRRFLTAEARKKLPPGYPVDVHFNPKYDPFRQRLCMSPDGDVFAALHKPNAEIVTDHIDTVLADGIRTRSGRFLPADIIVTATGLYVELFGTIALSVDGEPVHPGEVYCWRGCMLEGVPNAVAVIGYVAGTWTPGADAMARLTIKVIKRARAVGAAYFAPVLSAEEKANAPRHSVIDMNSAYFVRAHGRLPLAMRKGPWYGRENIVTDLKALFFGSLTDGMKYIMPGPRSKSD